MELWILITIVWKDISYESRINFQRRNSISLKAKFYLKLRRGSYCSSSLTILSRTSIKS